MSPAVPAHNGMQLLGYCDLSSSDSELLCWLCAGVTGIALAKAGAEVVLTDLPHITPLTSHNLELNCLTGSRAQVGTPACLCVCASPLETLTKLQPCFANVSVLFLCQTLDHCHTVGLHRNPSLPSLYILLCQDCSVTHSMHGLVWQAYDELHFFGVLQGSLGSTINTADYFVHAPARQERCSCFHQHCIGPCC